MQTHRVACFKNLANVTKLLLRDLVDKLSPKYYKTIKSIAKLYHFIECIFKEYLIDSMKGNQAGCKH